MQGLSKHVESEGVLRRIPICHVPAGSGNGISASCGLWTPATAAHAILRGRTSAMDAATVVQPASGARVLSVLCIQYGLLSNLDIETEHLRTLLGGERFTYGAIKEVLKWVGYRATVAWVDAEHLQEAREHGVQHGRGCASHQRHALACRNVHVRLCCWDFSRMTVAGPF